MGKKVITNLSHVKTHNLDPMRYPSVCMEVQFIFQTYVVMDLNTIIVVFFGLMAVGIAFGIALVGGTLIQVGIYIK